MGLKNLQPIQTEPNLFIWCFSHIHCIHALALAVMMDAGKEYEGKKNHKQPTKNRFCLLFPEMRKKQKKKNKTLEFVFWNWDWWTGEYYFKKNQDSDRKKRGKETAKRIKKYFLIAVEVVFLCACVCRSKWDENETMEHHVFRYSMPFIPS